MMKQYNIYTTAILMSVSNKLPKQNVTDEEMYLHMIVS